MSHEVCLSEDELRLVRLALERELDSTRTEHRHTRNLAYREEVKHHIQELERLLHVTFNAEHLAVHA
jgi:hypothetical protein